MAKYYYRSDFKEVDPYLRFDLNVTDIIYIDEYYSNYVANVGTIDALMDYVQNVMEYKYEEDHPLFALLTYPTKSVVNSIVGIAASIGGLCAPDEINVANGDLGKGTRSCITEFIGNSTDWPYEVNDESIEHTSRVSFVTVFENHRKSIIQKCERSEANFTF